MKDGLGKCINIKMKKFNNNQKIHSLLNLLRTSYKKLTIGIAITALVTTGVLAASKTVFNPTVQESLPLPNQVDKEQPEILGASESEGKTKEILTPAQAPDSFSNEIPQPTPTLTVTPTPYLISTPQSTPTSIAPTTVIIIQPTEVPTSIATPIPQPTLYVNPEIEAKLAELRQTLDDIYNQPVPMNVIYGKMERAYQDWIKNNSEIYSAIPGSRYINDLNSILKAYGL